ncbi:MAG TPA: bifunctional YncE family protein/alkaline phosphatase family protein [Candidatus Limnocylindrales bacterium]|nr:bifunctional YncE family protein/alkaline phosphatase family protein [Candidatus Limnocylindrales bacterium]
MKGKSFVLVTIALTEWGLHCFAGDFGATTATVGHNPNGFETPVNQLVTPAGTLVELPGIRPNALALSPDGQRLVTAGLTQRLIVVNPATGTILQRVRLPADDKIPPTEPVSGSILQPNEKAKLSFTGLVFSPDGTRIYLANVNGDIKVFSVSKDHEVTPLYSLPLPPANAPLRQAEIPAGIAVSPDGQKLYVAGNLANRLIELEAVTGKVLRTWDVGVAPFDVVLCKNKIYVSNWGGRRPDPDSLTGPAGDGMKARVDARSIASEGSVSVIDLNSELRTPNSELLTGMHACALALSPDGRWLVVANAGSDTLSVIATCTDKIAETICARQNPADLFGAQPNALAFDKSGKKLFVCNGTQNAVGVFRFKPGKSKLLGLIPVGWFPGSIASDAKRKEIYVANLKSLPAEMEQARSCLGNGVGFNTRQFSGSLSLVPVPSKKALARFTRTALADLRYPLLAQAALPARADQPARPVPERAGEPSVFHHVIYIIKENRSYDQVLGDIREGNGDANLCVFGENVTPNQHQLVRDFVLLDNTYCCSILSADGHQWTDTGIAMDYVEREFAGWPRSYPAGGSGEAGSDALAYSPAGFIWNDALAHGKTVCDFGEFTTARKQWKDSTRKGEPNFLDCYRDFLGSSNVIAYSCEPDIEALRPYIVTNTIGWDLDVPDVWRAAQFIKELKQFEVADNLPNLVILWLPNDHTSGTAFGSPTPAAQVADNDLAMGQVVEALSHGRYWKDTCIFAVEDDPQNGWDHVSGYRTTAYVASAYTRRGAVVSTQYNQTSFLRTMELMLGLPPMNQMDATATPMFDCFTNTADFTPFIAVANQTPLDQMNPAPKKISDLRLRRDAYVSGRLPLKKEDQCPEDVFNRILWDATKGPQTPYPVWAVNVVDDD